MKTVIIFFMFIFFILSCSKDYQHDFTTGKCTALKNNKSWISEARGNIFEDTLIFIELNQRNYLGNIIDYVGFSLKYPPIKGTYKIEKNRNDGYSYLSNYNFFYKDGSIIALYSIPNISDSYLSIKEFDEKTNWLKIEFNTSYYKDTPSVIKTRLVYPDSAIFTKGKIDVYLTRL